MKIYMKINRIIIIFLILLVLIPIIYIIVSSAKFFIVLSGSMVPTVHVGDGVLVRYIEPENIKVGDILVFYAGNSNKIIVSHRVIDIYKHNNDINFQTKGDNVEDKDPFIVKSKNVIGKVIFRIPYIGYLTKFSKRPLLFVIFTIIPSILIVLDEIKNMKRTPFQIMKIKRDEIKKKRKEERKMVRIDYKMLIISIFVANIIAIILYVAGFPYLRYDFWVNFSSDPYLSLVASYGVVQSIMMIVFSPLYIRNKLKINMGHKKKLGNIFAIRKYAI